MIGELPPGVNVRVIGVCGLEPVQGPALSTSDHTGYRTPNMMDGWMDGLSNRGVKMSNYKICEHLKHVLTNTVYPCYRREVKPLSDQHFIPNQRVWKSFHVLVCSDADRSFVRWTLSAGNELWEHVYLSLSPFKRQGK